MSRPKKATVDYFPHSVTHGKTMFTLESKYGNDGYSFWFKLLELLGSAENHYLDANDPVTWEYLLAKTLVNEDNAKEILDTLAKLGSINKNLWQHYVIRSDKFIENLADVYTRRAVNVINNDEVLGLCQHLSQSVGVSDNKNPQSKVKKSKEEKSKEENIYCEVINYLNQKTNSKYKVTDTHKTHIAARIKEGATLEDFKTVIDKKYADWQGTQWEKFLRPQTLFGTKFDSYLNEKTTKIKTEGDKFDEDDQKLYDN